MSSTLTIHCVDIKGFPSINYMNVIFAQTQPNGVFIMFLLLYIFYRVIHSVFKYHVSSGGVVSKIVKHISTPVLCPHNSRNRNLMYIFNIVSFIYCLYIQREYRCSSGLWRSFCEDERPRSESHIRRRSQILYSENRPPQHGISNAKTCSSIGFWFCITYTLCKLTIFALSCIFTTP